jgi:ATP-dependent Clp protease adaptor protein ClpS
MVRDGPRQGVHCGSTMANGPKKWDDTDGDLAVRRERKVEKARRYQVVFHNDHYTTKWFVIDVLMRFFHMSEASATSFMLAVHRTGNGVAGVYTKDIAESKVADVMEYAREYEMPLKLTAEPED